MCLAVLAVALSAIAFYFSTGFNHIWWAAWIAPIPVLFVAFRGGRPEAWVAPFVAYLLGIFHIARYLHFVLGWTQAILMPILMACAFTGCVLFARATIRQLPPGIAVFAFPVAWTSYEFLVSLVSPHGTFFNYAYSQMDALPVIQIASVTGIWGVSFVIMLAASILAMWRRQAEISGLIVLVILGFGMWRLDRPAKPTRTAGLITADAYFTKSWNAQDPAQAIAIANEWADRIQSVAQQGATIVVLPEKFLAITLADQQQVYAVFGRAARTTRTTVVAGLNFVGIHPPRNIAAVFSPNGQPVIIYDKHHMLQGPETPYAPGNEIGLFNAAASNWGVEICKDMDYPVWSRQYGRQDIPFLAVPAWDFVMDAWLHDRMAVMRGVENGFSIVRVAQQGLLTISDAYGRILAERMAYAAPVVELVRPVPAGPGETFYSRYGDWFGWLSLAALFSLITARIRLKNTAQV